VGIVLPVSRLRGHNPVEYVPAAGLVGMPETETSVGVLECHLAHRGIDSLLVQHCQKGQIHVNIVIKARRIFVIFEHQVFIPPDRHIVLNPGAQPTELGRAPVSTADHLADPASLDLVPDNIGIKSDSRRLKCSTEKKDRDKAEWIKPGFGTGKDHGALQVKPDELKSSRIRQLKRDGAAWN